jgi:hypothetical protein
MNDGGTVRTSTIYIGVGKETRVYSSVDDVPPELRRRLVKSTSSGNSVSILIADEKGREEIARAIQGLPSPVQSRLAGVLRRGSRETRRSVSRSLWKSWKLWVELAVVGSAGLAVWVAFTWR